MGRRRLKLIVNAVPLVNVRTGIGRYIQCLYGELERAHSDSLEIGYFDGRSVSERMPLGPTDLSAWSRRVDLFWRLPTYPALMLRLAHHLLREVYFRQAVRGFDLYHETAFFPFGKACGVKTVFTVHDLSLMRFPQFHPRERVLFSRLFFRRRCRDVSVFLTVSDFTKSEVRSLLGVQEKRITTTPLSHDSSIFFPRNRSEVRDARGRLSLPERYFLFVGTGDPRKNLGVVLRAMERQSPGVSLVVAGWSGWGGGAVPGVGIRFLGYVDDEDLARLYSGAEALLYPSVYEGFGLPVLEAMACGCPVICSRLASLPEVGGDAALYLEDPADDHELSSLMTGMVSSDRSRAARAEIGLMRAELFSWEHTAQKTHQALSRFV